MQMSAFPREGDIAITFAAKIRSGKRRSLNATFPPWGSPRFPPAPCRVTRRSYHQGVRRGQLWLGLFGGAGVSQTSRGHSAGVPWLDTRRPQNFSTRF